MHKKGQGLPLTTIIVAILVVVVLVVIVAFFLGGATGLTNTIKRIFYGTTSGTDLSVAVEACRTHCDRAEGLPPSLQPTSAYCTQTFPIDTDRDGEADFEEINGVKTNVQWYCNKPGITKEGLIRSLNVPCSISCTPPKQDTGGAIALENPGDEAH